MLNCLRRDIFLAILMTFSMMSTFKYTSAYNAFGMVYCEITHIFFIYIIKRQIQVKAT